MRRNRSIQHWPRRVQMSTVLVAIVVARRDPVLGELHRPADHRLVTTDMCLNVSLEPERWETHVVVGEYEEITKGLFGTDVPFRRHDVAGQDPPHFQPGRTRTINDVPDIGALIG